MVKKLSENITNETSPYKKFDVLDCALDLSQNFIATNNKCKSRLILLSFNCEEGEKRIKVCSLLS